MDAKIIQGEKTDFAKKLYWENWTSSCQRMKWNAFLTLYVKMNSKRIRGLNLGGKTRKLLEENRGKLHNVRFGKGLYDTKTIGNKRE